MRRLSHGGLIWYICLFPLTLNQRTHLHLHLHTATARLEKSEIKISLTSHCAMRISLADVLLTLLVRPVSWEAFLAFSSIRHGSLRTSQNMMVVCWAKDCKGALIGMIYLFLTCIGPKPKEVRRGRNKDDKTIWLVANSRMYFFKAMLLSASFYTQAWNHTAHVCQRMNAHKRHACSSFISF